MGFLKFYIISTAISITIVLIKLAALSDRAEREGYKGNTKYTPIERIDSIIPWLIPIFNIFLAMVTLCYSKKIYENITKDFHKDE